MSNETPVTSEGVPAPVQTEFVAGEEDDDVLGGKVGAMEQVTDRAGIVRELFEFLWARKLYWMLPMVIVLLLFGVMMVIASSTPVGPFIYTLF